MTKNFVAMGDYYNAEPYGLVRTVCRGYDNETGKSMIAYVNIKTGGIASEIFLMPEEKFKNIFMGG